MDGDKARAGEDVDTDSNSTEDEKESPNEPLPTESPFHSGSTLGRTESPDAATPGNSRVTDATSAGCLEHQLWVKGTMWHTRNRHHRIPVLLLSFAGGRSLCIHGLVGRDGPTSG